MQSLVFDLDLYFKRLPGAIEIDLSLLCPKRSDEDSMKRAWNFMAKAALGEVAKRQPISVVKLDQGKFDILDGNSTFAVALASGWPRILALECHPEDF